MPGSLSLKSVHSGVYRGMRRRAWLKMSSNLLVSSSGAIRGTAFSPCVGGSFRPLVDEERVDQVEERVVGAHAIVDADQQVIAALGRRFHADLHHVDARLPTGERPLDAVADYSPQRRRVRL